MAAAVVDRALVLAALVRRLVLPLAAVVGLVAHLRQRDAHLASRAAVEFGLQVAAGAKVA